MKYSVWDKKRWMHKSASVFAAFLVLFSLFLPYVPTACASGAVLKVGYSASEGISVDKNGDHSGYIVDYLDEVSRYTGWKFEYVPDTWDGCMNALEQGEIDILPFAFYDPERAERFLYSALDMGANYLVLYVLPDSDIYYQDYSAFDTCRIGLAADSFFERALAEYIDGHDLNSRIVTFPTGEDAERALSAGEIDIIATSVFASVADCKIVDSFDAAPSYIITGRQNRELMDKIDAAMRQIEMEQPDLIPRLIAQYRETISGGLHLTREEQEYIDSAGTINIRMFPNRHPIIYYKGGEVKGILPDYLDRLGELTGLTFHFLQTETDAALTEAALLEKDGSLLLSSSTDVAEQTELLRSSSIMQLALGYVKRINDPADFEPSTFAVLRHMTFLKELLSQEYAVVSYDSVDACMDAVMRDEADMTVQFELVSAYLLQKPQYASNLMEWVGADYAVDVYLYGGAEHATLFSILDKTQKYISDEERSHIVSASLMDHTYTKRTDDLWYQYRWVVLMSILALALLAMLRLLRRRSRRAKEKEQENEELQRRLWTDQLTGLHSREGFFEKSREMLRAETGEVYIVRVNICHFKLINELRGTEKCDRLLQSIGAHLNEKSREIGFVAGRFTADYFYLCIRREDFERFDIRSRTPVSWLKMDISITYGVYPADGETPVSVMCDRANMALSSNDRGGFENVYYYDDSFHQRLLQEQAIENEMERALAERQFCIYIQPKINVDTGQIIGGEALVRWRHPERGMIPPFAFIKVFEKNGFILQLDYFVWEETCRFLAETRESGLPCHPISINISRTHFYSGDLVSLLTGLIKKYRLEAKELELEITENIYAGDPEIILEQCALLQKLGFKIAMDDFGSGISSLNMLRRMPLDIIKMDLKFLEDDADREQTVKGRDILRAQIELAHTIGLDVVVEGLETQEQQKFIREIGSCAAQGYYYAKPMPTGDFAELLKSADTEASGLSNYGMAAAIRRERLRREQLQPLLEVISTSENLIGYLLPEKDAVLCGRLSRDMGVPKQVPRFGDHVIESNLISPESVPQFKELLRAAEQGESTGSTLVEYMTPEGEREVHWVQFNMVMDFEGNPLIAMFNVIDFGDVSTQVDMLMDSKRSQAEVENQRMKENEKLLSIITQHSDRVVCLYDVGRRTSRIWNQEMCKECRLPRLCETTVEGILESGSITPEGRDTLRQMFLDIDNGVASGDAKVRVYSEEGDLRWYDLLYSTICDNKGQPVSALISHKDVTKQYEHEMAYLRQFQSLSETEFSLGLMEVDLTADRIELQDSLFAPIKNAAVGGSMLDFAEQMITMKMQEEHWEEARTFFSPKYMLRQHDLGNRLLTRTWPMTFHSGKHGWVRFDVELIADIYTGHIRAYFRLWDVTTIREKQLEIQQRSERDGMTGVYNRATAEERISEKMADRSDRGIFMLLDIDRLKRINDEYGHAGGDKAIASVAQTLKGHFRSSDIIGRMGGDEFAAYMPGAAKNREVISGTITELLRRIGALSVGENEEMGITCSIGCVVEQEDSTCESLYRQADKALYHVKQGGGNNFVFYTPEMENEDFVHQMDRPFSLDHAKRSETGEVQHLLTALSDYYHLVLACNISENKYHLMQEVKDGIFSQMPTFGKMDTMVNLSMARMPDEDARRFDNAVSRRALLEAGARGEKHVKVAFDFQDFDGVYKPAECTSILYRNERGDLCEFALIRWA